MEELKRSIVQLEAAIASAKERKKEAEAEAAKLEKDMKEFGQNKESKLKELKVRRFANCCLDSPETYVALLHVGRHYQKEVRRSEEKRQV